MAAARLADLAVIIRSKNAGPYRLTFDVLLPDAAAFKRVKASISRPRSSSVGC